MNERHCRGPFFVLSWAWESRNPVRAVRPWQDSGFIKDPSGATTLQRQGYGSQQYGVERQTTTNDSGYYVVTNVRPACTP